DEHVDLVALETAVVITKRHALGAVVAAGVQRDRFARAADGVKVLVDEKRAVVIIEAFVAADEARHVVDVTRVVDHALKRAAELVSLLVTDAAVLGMIFALHPAVPAFARERARDLLDAGIRIGDFLLREG